jgi:predicted Fe-Mo cluster-binding NifX family protein
MRIAIPMFGARVSPRFDSAPSLLLVSASDGAVQDETVESMEDVRGSGRIELLSGHGVDVLLCGGIRRCDYFSIVAAGIEVYPGLMGEAQDVLDAFLCGGLPKGDVIGSLIPVGPRRQRERAGRRRSGLRSRGQAPRKPRQRGSSNTGAG